MPKENQRVVISKRLLKDGVMKLLKKKHISDISISELCEEAEINRTTFYRHYQTVHDVLMEIELDYMNEFYEVPAPTNNTKDIRQYAVRMCNFLYDNSEIAKLFIKNNTDNDFRLLFQNFADDFLSSRLVHYKGKAVNANTLRLMTTFFSYGIYSMVRQWLIEEIPMTPDEVADLIVGSFNRDFSFI